MTERQENLLKRLDQLEAELILWMELKDIVDKYTYIRCPHWEDCTVYSLVSSYAEFSDCEINAKNVTKYILRSLAFAKRKALVIDKAEVANVYIDKIWNRELEIDDRDYEDDMIELCWYIIILAFIIFLK